MENDHEMELAFNSCSLEDVVVIREPLEVQKDTCPLSHLSPSIIKACPGCERSHECLNETNETNSTSQSKQIEDLKDHIKSLDEKIRHLEVHCYMYQASLLNVKKGVKTWKQVTENQLTTMSAICHHCGTEQLMNTIAMLQEQITTLKKSKD